MQKKTATDFFRGKKPSDEFIECRTIRVMKKKKHTHANEIHSRKVKSNDFSLLFFLKLFQTESQSIQRHTHTNREKTKKATSRLLDFVFTSAV